MQFRDPCASGWLLAGIVCVGAIVRFATLGSQSFRWEEAFTDAIVREDPPKEAAIAAFLLCGLDDGAT